MQKLKDNLKRQRWRLRTGYADYPYGIFDLVEPVNFYAKLYAKTYCGKPTFGNAYIINCRA